MAGVGTLRAPQSRHRRGTVKSAHPRRCGWSRCGSATTRTTYRRPRWDECRALVRTILAPTGLARTRCANGAVVRSWLHCPVRRGTVDMGSLTERAPTTAVFACIVSVPEDAVVGRSCLGVLCGLRSGLAPGLESLVGAV